MKAAEHSNSCYPIKPDLLTHLSVFWRGQEILPRFYSVARAVYPKFAVSDWADRLLFVFRSLRCHPHASDWYDWLNEPLMAAAIRVNPMLYRKIIRPYVSPGWTTDRKLRVMTGHHEYVATRLTRTPFIQTCTREGLGLLNIAHEGEEYQIRGVSDQKFSKEGELTLVLFSTKYNCHVSSLTFVIVESDTGPSHVMIIGGSQGLPAQADKNIIKEVSKLLHGLRPKALLLFAAQEIARAWQLDGIRAASNRTHISRHSDYALNRTRRPKLSYDEFWDESGGKSGSDDYYDLPMHYVRRTDAEIKSNKRSLYHQRYKMLDRLSTELQVRLSDLAPSPRIAEFPLAISA